MWSFIYSLPCSQHGGVHWLYLGHIPHSSLFSRLTGFRQGSEVKKISVHWLPKFCSFPVNCNKVSVRHSFVQKIRNANSFERNTWMILEFPNKAFKVMFPWCGDLTVSSSPLPQLHSHIALSALASIMSGYRQDVKWVQLWENSEESIIEQITQKYRRNPYTLFTSEIEKSYFAVRVKAKCKIVSMVKNTTFLNKKNSPWEESYTLLAFLINFKFEIKIILL